ncbi:MAG: LysR family transcriptional regulator [Lachnospiraceae bacterium]|nr:LysR family transcriptional regulator [Lachnospiraceae bacterium]
MDIEVLKEFVTLSEVLNFSETAKKHYITQPVLSKHISQLEAEIGALLFYRNRQSVSLTEAGATFLEDAACIIQTYENSIKKIRSLHIQYNSSLKRTLLAAASRKDLRDYIRAFSQKYPSCSLEPMSCNIPQTYRMLDDHECDISLTVQLPSKNDALYDACHLYRDPLCVVVPTDHPLAECPSVSFEDIKNENILMASTDLAPNYREFINHLLSSHHIKNIMFQYVQSVEQGFLLAASGNKVSIVPKHQKSFAASGV